MIAVEVCYAERDRAVRVGVTLATGATVSDAIERSGIAATISRDLASLGVAVFGRRAAMDTVLSDGDRVELLRPLVVDPKEARRRRAVKKQRDDASAICSTEPPATAAG